MSGIEHGRCGNRAASGTAVTNSHVVCNLTWGHGGWHRGDDGSEWTHGDVGAKFAVADIRPFMETIDVLSRMVVAVGGSAPSAETEPAKSGLFFIGDKVRVVIEGTLMGFNGTDGHYYLKGNSLGADHLDWLHRLHWATEFEVLEPGPRNLGDGATNADDAWNGGKDE